MSYIRELATAAKNASRTLASLSTEEKNRALLAMADQLEMDCPNLIEANARDLENARENKLSSAFVDRLTLNAARIESMANGIREIVELPDPVGEVTESYQRPNGLKVSRVRIPLGVIGFIYESRPNVTSDAAALCLKSGNAVILRGGKEAFESNLAIMTSLKKALTSTNVSSDAINLITDLDYSVVDELLSLHDLIDLIIPRGGEQMINAICEKSRIPVLKHAKGVCHVYVDESADLEKALQIVINSKCDRPSVCNALETLLVHEKIAVDFLRKLEPELQSHNVEIRGCPVTQSILPQAIAANADDWTEEYLDLVLAVRVVRNFDEAIDHITRYGSLHTDSILTENERNAEAFVRRVDSSAVLINASTRFNDGNALGLGAEIGISTTKLHAYGPMGLRELTTRKFVVTGTGQIRC